MFLILNSFELYFQWKFHDRCWIFLINKKVSQFLILLTLILFYITFPDFGKKIECFMSYWHLPQSYVFIRIPIYIQKCSFFNLNSRKKFFVWKRVASFCIIFILHWRNKYWLLYGLTQKREFWLKYWHS